MPFWVHWQRAGTDLCPKKEKHSSDDLLGRRGRCCSLFPALRGICGKSKNIVSFSFNHLQLLSWPARSLFLRLLCSSQKPFNMKLSRITHDKLTDALPFISLLSCHSWLSIKDSFIFLASTQAVRWGCIWIAQHSAETFQSCTREITSISESSGLMLTWCLPGLASPLSQEYPWDCQLSNRKLHTPSRCAVARGNLNLAVLSRTLNILWVLHRNAVSKVVAYARDIWASWRAALDLPSGSCESNSCGLLEMLHDAPIMFFTSHVLPLYSDSWY